MSGQPSGPPSSRGGETNCASLIEETVLNSPNPKVVEKLRVGDVLELHLQKTGKAVALYAMRGAEAAGSITSSLLSKIIDCINDGFEYVAVVQKVSGGACRIQIRPKS